MIRIVLDAIKSLHDFIERDVIAPMAKGYNSYPCSTLQVISKLLLQPLRASALHFSLK
jgi:hypothetical protein